MLRQESSRPTEPTMPKKRPHRDDADFKRHATEQVLHHRRPVPKSRGNFIVHRSPSKRGSVDIIPRQAILPL